MIRFLAAFIILIGASIHLGAQCDIPPSTPDCESAPIICNFDDINGYCTSMQNNQTGNGPTPLCNNGNGGVPNNPIWFAFYAGCTSLNITITPSNCTPQGGSNGIQAGLYGYGGNGLCTNSYATPAEYIACSGNCPMTNPINLNANGLVIGQIYYFLIDGCAGAYCDISVSIAGSCGAPNIADWGPNPLQGPTLICSGATGSYTIIPPEGAIEFHWYLDGQVIQEGPDQFLDIEWTSAGTYELCVDASNQCVSEFDNPAPTCITIEVYDVTPENPDPVLICEDDDYTYAGDKYVPGVYDVMLTTPQGCDSIVELTVNGDPHVVEQLGAFYLCEADVIVVGGAQFNSNDQGSQEIVIPKSQYPYCDSTIQFDIIFMTVDAYIFNPIKLGCDIDQVELDGGNSLVDPSFFQTIYTWEAFNGGILGDPADEPTMTVMDTGKYCLTVEIIAPDGSNSCKDSACVHVGLVDVPNIQATGDIITCTDPVGNLTGSSITPLVNYKWLDAAGNVISTNPSTTSTTPGNYTFVVTDPSGCSSTKSVTLTANNTGPNINVQGGLITCANPNVNLVGSSNTNGVSYSWADASGNVLGTTPTVPAPGPGTYTLTVLNPANGCSSTKDTIVSIDQVAPLPTATADTLTCSVPNPTITGGSNIQNPIYTWIDPSGNFYSNMKDTTVSVSGSYTLTVYNPLNGCSNDTTIIVPENTGLPSASAVGDTLTCVITTTTLVGQSGTPGATFSWTNPSGNPAGNTASINVTVPGIYTLTVTGLNGCTKTTTAEAILDAQIPSINVAQTDDTITCKVPAITLTGTSDLPVTFAWTNAANQPLGTNSTLPVNTQGQYTLVVLANNGCTNTQTVPIGEDIGIPVIDFVEGGEIDCLTGIDTLTAISSTPGVTFQWYNDGGVPTDPGPDPEVNEPGTYTVIVTGYNGCKDSADVDVTLSVDAPQTPDATDDGPITCAQSSVNLVASSSTPGVTYSWNGPSGPNSTPSYTTTLPGTYNVTITNPANGCTVKQSTQVAIDTIHPVVQPTGDQITCIKPAVDISVTSIPTNVNYAWSDPSGNPTGGNTSGLNVSVSGTYQVQVTNPVNGCVTTIPVQVTENTTQPDLAPLTVTPITCTNPTATIQSTSMTAVNYQWVGPDINGTNATVEDPVVSLPGQYSVVITNPINGCTNTQSINVVEDKVDPTVDVSGGIIDCTQPSRTLTATTTPTTNITTQWMLNGNPIPGTGPTISASQPGIYTLTVTNTINGCVGQDTALVVLDDQTPDVTATGGTITCLDPQVDIIGNSTTAGITYSWTGPGFTSNNAIETVTNVGSYVLTVTAPNGCTNTATAIVDEDRDLPTAVAASSNIIDCTNETTTLSSAGSSTGAEFSYSWTDPNGSFVSASNTVPDVSIIGTYTLTVVNTVNGCSASTTVDVIDNQNLPTGINVLISDPRCFGFKDGFISVTGVTGGSPDYLYSLNGGPFTPNPQFSGLGDGSYTITVQDAAGCLYTAPEYDLTEPQKLEVELGEDFILQWGRDTFLYALITPPTAVIESISWTPTGIDTTFNTNEILIKPFNQTLYSVTVLDSAGCRAEDKVLVLVEKRRPIYIPNVFSPNGEQNTRFFIQSGAGVEEIEKMEIFNRWGERVFINEGFLPNDPSEGWDGNIRNRPANPEVFVYYAKIRFNDGITILYKGDVTLMR
ncbi:MAG: gliding motility-associated C-terminal domain-containing protein [Saprospiraceae bacterium]|nr:gliding motility-associated C-terminal domain-containing protein [Saprospiraceae bacterium]